MSESKIFWSLVFSAILLTSGIAGSTQSVSASEGYFESNYGKQVSNTPTVCIFQPNEPLLSEQRWNLWYHDMTSALATWETVLEQATTGDWNITTVNVPIEKLDLLNESACDISVKFVKEPYKENGKYANALGWWPQYSDTVYIVYTQSKVCGKEYSPEFHIMINKVCFGNIFERSKMMASVLQHEFGHAIGMGHYVSYDYGFMQNWYDTGIGYPSIMTPMPSNEELKQITDIDVQEIRKIYGSNGFGKKTDSITPIFNERVIPEPVIVVSEKAEIHLSEGKQSSYFISGFIPDKLYKRGEYLQIIIQKPNGDIEYEAISVSKTLKSFKHSLIFDYSEPVGKYNISLVFDGKEFDKKEIHISKDGVEYGRNDFGSSKKITPKTFTKSTSNIDRDNDGIIDTKDLCNTKPETYNGYKDTDGCPDTKVTPIEKNQSQKMKLQSEAGILQQESYSKLEEFKKDILVSKKSLEQTSANSPEQQRTLDKAWNLLKSNQIILSNMEERFQKGDLEISKEKYDEVEYLFAIRSHESKRIGENLIEISQLIEESNSQIIEEVKPQSCFLFWCW